ncbi:MAG: TlpA family protein disulfide reductase, partial [Chitinophagaceae bacterium]
MLSSGHTQPGDYSIAYDLYSQMGMWDKANAMMMAGSHRFPNGLMAMQVALSRFGSLRMVSIDSLIAGYFRFKQRFPNAFMQSASTKIQDEMLSTIASQYIDSGDYKKFMFFASQIKDPIEQANEYYFQARELMTSNKGLPFADSILKMSLNIVLQSIDNPGRDKHSYQTNSDWAKEMQKTYAQYADFYAMLLNKEGKMKEAVDYEKKAVNYLDDESPILNEHYVQYLLDAKDYKVAQERLESFFINGSSTDKMNTDLKPLYIRLNHSEKGYIGYLLKLEEKANIKLKTDMTNEILNEPAPRFTLPDLYNKQISMATLKGKVVVLDFWATWCGPCKLSFPGMQKVVENYKSDTNVVFLF